MGDATRELKRHLDALHAFALSLPETTEGVACKGTALESRTVQVRGKAFVFLRDAEIRMKLGPSVAEITALAKKEPARYQTGAGGWSKVTLGGLGPAPAALAEKWIEESWRLLAPKSLASPAKPAGRRRAPADR